ncbi:MAG TPA: DUF2147 domain-containing protein [Alphaproteobacteria bacterium]|nr:DUF2147 domain-containing protein [Alphaproteobacteria bacterium]
MMLQQTTLQGRAERALFALVTVLGLAAAAGAALAAPAPVVGRWATEEHKAEVRIAPCAEGLCGTIVWLKEPLDEAGQPRRDRNNPDQAKRGRGLVGTTILRGFKADGRRYTDGTIYNPEDGETYDSSMHLVGEDTLKVKGCVWLFCRSQTWTRVE